MTLHRRATGPRDHGHRGPVLFVHGFPFDGSMWTHQMDGLPGHWRGIAPDLRGFGRSDLAPGDDGVPTGREAGRGVALHDEPVLTMDRLADDLARLLDDEGGEPAVVCALSMGGYVAFALRRRHPHLVRALVLADTRAGEDDEAGRENRRRTAATVRERGTRPLAAAMVPSLLAERSLESRPDVVDHTQRMILATSPATVIAALAGMAERPDVSDELGDVEVPTLVAVGEHDALTPPDDARALAGAIPGARLEIVPDAAHLAPLENPAAFNRVFLDFLDGLGD